LALRDALVFGLALAFGVVFGAGILFALFLLIALDFEADLALDFGSPLAFVLAFFTTFATANPFTQHRKRPIPPFPKLTVFYGIMPQAPRRFKAGLG
jgi:Na+/glutamate symporter